MNTGKFWLLTTVVCLSMILVFSVAGCRGEVTSEEAAKEETLGEEKPDKELFNKYFSHVSMGGARGFFGGVVEENVSTFLPHQEGRLNVRFKGKEGFTFRTGVFNLKAKDFVKRCTTTAATSSEEAGGFSMEISEWAFLRPGNYEYRIYVEDTLVAVLPFEFISYVYYFFGK